MRLFLCRIPSMHRFGLLTDLLVTFSFAQNVQHHPILYFSLDVFQETSVAPTPDSLYLFLDCVEESLGDDDFDWDISLVELLHFLDLVFFRSCHVQSLVCSHSPDFSMMGCCLCFLSRLSYAFLH